MSGEWKKRTDLNKIEQIKLRGDGLKIYEELDELTEKPPNELTFDDTERLKWAGVLHQKPRNGRFLVHIKLPSGELSADQAEKIAELSKRFGDGKVQFTTRQACQIHGCALSNIPTVLRQLKEAGLTSMEADGDVVRNITGNPLMGVDPEEVLDTTELVHELTETFSGKQEFSNLPRKFKISVSGNPHDVAFARENDMGFVPAIFEENGEKRSGFHVYLGGGLAGSPQQLAQKTDFFLEEKDVVPFAKAVVTIFREDGDRTGRAHARFKYLLNEEGIEEICCRIDEMAGPFQHGGNEITADWCYGTFYGMHPQKQKDLFFAGLHIPCNILSCDDLKTLAHLSKVYGEGRLRITNVQSILILDIPRDRLLQFEKEEILKRYPLSPGMFSGYESACTGSSFCNFAAVETRHRLKNITEQLDADFPEITHPFRITLTGCGACCAAPQTADIGIRGGKGMREGQVIDAFFLYIGGELGSHAHLGTLMKGKIPYDQLLTVLRKIIRYYLMHRIAAEETFSHFVQRTGTEEIQKIISACAM